MSLPPELDPSVLDDLVSRAIAEDLGEAGDITSQLLVGTSQQGKARIVAKSHGILAGVPVAHAVFTHVDRNLEIDWSAADGDTLEPGTVVATIAGRARAILAAERVALNFLQHLSGVATVTAEFAAICKRYGVRLLCTRKTLPGLRAAERYAVTVGGGSLHRAGLYDAILIKTNHIKLCGGIREAVKLAQALPGYGVEVEVKSIEELSEAIAAGADTVLLDNADVSTIELAVRGSGNASLEISGGVTLENVEAIARAGPDAISVGRITHSAPSVDLALHFSGDSHEQA